MRKRNRQVTIPVRPDSRPCGGPLFRLYDPDGNIVRGIDSLDAAEAWALTRGFYWSTSADGGCLEMFTARGSTELFDSLGDDA